ncbi:MAG TPA: hypothetical protein VFE47_19240 [Tepidisphaeraceae bacterium]|jgi:hypothetical protein|nr:hypothetical protein [Tepidisphaeraceae bacterium]
MKHLIFLYGTKPSAQGNGFTAIQVATRLALDSVDERWSGWIGREANASVPCAEAAVSSAGDAGARAARDTAAVVRGWAENRIGIYLSRAPTLQLPMFFSPEPYDSVQAIPVAFELIIRKLADLPDVTGVLGRFASLAMRSKPIWERVLEMKLPEGAPAWLNRYREAAEQMDLSPPLRIPVQTNDDLGKEYGVLRLTEDKGDGVFHGILYFRNSRLRADALVGTTLARTVEWREGTEQRALTRSVLRIIKRL